MLKEIARSFRHGEGGIRSRIVLMYSFLIALNVGVWGLALLVFHRYPMMLGTCLLAYGFGLRHAVDADHIAAIDNVTRKLMQEDKQPVAVGFFFSLGHSTVVVLLSIAIALGAAYVHDRFPQLERIGGLIGTSVSALFLLTIAFINFLVFLDIYRVFQDVRSGRGYSEETLEEFLDKRGLLARFFRPLYKFVNKSWHMYIVGFLFGLGFDTATEIALLGISASQAAQGLPIWSIMIFPALFMSGMCLIDTSDGVVMLGAYGWAFVDPVRKLFYNMVITLVSFLVALLIGGIEALTVIASELKLETGFWAYIDKINDHYGNIGFFIIGIFVASWLVATLIYKAAKLDKVYTGS